MDHSADRARPAAGSAAVVRLRNVPLPEPHLLGMAASVGMQRLRPWVLPGSRKAGRFVGCAMCIAGTCLVVRSLDAAGHSDLEHPDRLVTTGPFAFTRNPMYLGWVLLHVGSVSARGSGWMLVTLPPVAVLMHRQVLREERALREKFVDEYGHYCASVPRYLPGWRREAWGRAPD